MIGYGPPQPGYRALSADDRRDLRARLSFCYDPVRVFDIMSDDDQTARADLGAWRRLLGLGVNQT